MFELFIPSTTKTDMAKIKYNFKTTKPNTQF